MRHLVDTYLSARPDLTVADLGSCDVNGSYRPFFDRPGWHYIGVDLAPGANVDCVLESPYRFPLPSASVDAFISGQAFEHVEFFWLTWLEMVRVLRPGGLIFLIAPSRGPEHRFPVDCWRFYPDGYAALAKWAALDLVEATTDWEPDAEPGSAPWGDTVGVFRKRSQGWKTRATQALTRRLLHLLAPASAYLNTQSR
jgi:SAM-dependent methyltransferase